MQFHWLKWLWINRQQVSAFQGLHAEPPDRDVNKLQAVFVGTESCPPQEQQSSAGSGLMEEFRRHSLGRARSPTWQEKVALNDSRPGSARKDWGIINGKGWEGLQYKILGLMWRHQATRMVFRPHFLFWRGVDGQSVPVNFRLDKGLLG